MTAGWVRATMKEECLEILQSVEDAMAQETRGAPGCNPPDGARIAACLHLQRAAMRSVMMQRQPATWNRSLRRPSLSASPRSQKLVLQ
jgi:hypothetical protein